jgi:hypothetical protein
MSWMLPEAGMNIDESSMLKPWPMMNLEVCVAPTFSLSSLGSHSGYFSVGWLCFLLATNPFAQAVTKDFPPFYSTPPSDPTAPCFGKAEAAKGGMPRDAGDG